MPVSLGVRCPRCPRSAPRSMGLKAFDAEGSDDLGLPGLPACGGDVTSAGRSSLARRGRGVSTTMPQALCRPVPGIAASRHRALRSGP